MFNGDASFAKFCTNRQKPLESPMTSFISVTFCDSLHSFHGVLLFRCNLKEPKANDVAQVVHGFREEDALH